MGEATAHPQPTPVGKPHAAPPQSSIPTKRRTTTAGYWVGAVVAALATLGAVAWGAFAFLGWRANVEDFPRLTPPDSAVVSVTDTGTRYIYLEHDRSTALPSVPAVTVTGPAGAQVPLVAHQGQMRYDVPGVADRIGDAAMTFRVNEPGTYRVTVAAADKGTVVAVGDDLLSGWGPQVIGVVTLLLVGWLVGLTLVIVTAARRAGPTS